MIDKLDLYGKVGLYNIDVESTSIIAGNTVTTDSDEEELFGTVGVEYDMGKVNLFAEFTVADTDINELTIDIVTAGIKYEF